MKKILSLALIITAMSMPLMAQEKTNDDTNDKKNESAIPQPEQKDIVVPDRPWKTIGLTVGLDYLSDYLWRGTYWFEGEGAFFPHINYSVLDTGLTISFAAEISQNYLYDGTEDATVGARQSLDFGLDYSYSFNGLASIGAGVWYYYMFNREDNSFMTMTIWSEGFEKAIKK